jgi:hypothetical protein
MDPTANLREQLSLSRRIIDAWDHCQPDGTLTSEQAEKVCDEANRLADLVTALHEWIGKGNGLPTQWARR